MHRSETVGKTSVFYAAYATTQMTAVLHRTITAMTTLALYSIISGAFALSVFCLPARTSRPNFFAVYSQFHA